LAVKRSSSSAKQGKSKSPAKKPAPAKIVEEPAIAVKLEQVKAEPKPSDFKQESNSMLDFEMFLQTQFGAALPITKTAP